MKKTIIYLLLVVSLLSISTEVSADVSPLSAGIIMDDSDNTIY